MKSKPGVFWLWVTMFMMVSQGLSAQLFVATNGNDSASGTILDPLLTINEALMRAVSGDFIVLREGTYQEAVRIRQPNLTLQSYEGEWATIQVPTDVEDLDACVTLDVDADDAVLRRLEIVGGYYYGVFAMTRWDWGDPEDRSGPQRVLVEECVIHHTGRDGIKITPGTDGFQVIRCEIYQTGVRNQENAEGIDNVNGDGTTIQDCYLHDIATTGVYLKGGAREGIIERTRVERCGGLGIALGFDTSPEYFDLEVNPQRYENVDGIVRNCTIRDTSFAGIGLYGAKNPKIYNNTLVNCAQEGQSVLFFGVTLQDWEPDADPADGFGYRPATVNPDIRNNIMSQSNGMGSPMVEIRTFHHESTGRVNALEGMPGMDYNSYHINASAPLFNDLRPEYELEGLSFAAWQVHTGSDTESLISDPLLDDNLALRPGSPCIGSGVEIPSVVDDFFGNPRVVPYDRGAIAAMSAPVFQQQYLIPHVASNYYTTILEATNPGVAEVHFQLTLISESHALSDEGTYAVAPLATLRLTLSQDGGDSALGGFVHANPGTLLLKVIYRSGDGGLAEFLLSPEKADTLLYSFPNYSDAIAFKGLACLNTSPSPITVTLDLYGEGEKLGSETHTIAGFGRLLGLLATDGGFFASQPLDSVGMVLIRASEATLSGMLLSGVDQSRLLFVPPVAWPPKETVVGSKKTAAKGLHLRPLEDVPREGP